MQKGYLPSALDQLGLFKGVEIATAPKISNCKLDMDNSVVSLLAIYLNFYSPAYSYSAPCILAPQPPPLGQVAVHN